MFITKKRLRKGFAALEIQHPVMQIFSTHKNLFITIATIFIVISSSSVYYLVKDPSDIWPNLAASAIEIALIGFFAVMITIFKINSGAENVRINQKIHGDIDDSLLIPLNFQAKDVKIRFKQSDFYEPPGFLNAFWRFSKIDRENFFLSEAGALDIPKLALKKITTNKTMTIELGHASFYDIFFTHYCPDLVISKISHTELETEKTIRNVLGSRLKKHYLSQLNRAAPESGQNLILPKYLPNPLGISGIVLIKSGRECFAILRKRGGDEIAAQKTLEWSFAGTFESLDWLGSNEIPLKNLVECEYSDEVVYYSPRLKDYLYELHVIGFVINELYLFQPELFITLTIEMDLADLKHIGYDFKKNSNGRIIIAPINEIPSLFSKSKTKNLCSPGLVLLKKFAKNFLPDNEI